MVEKSWRTFYGQWGEWSHVDESGLTWEQARSRLAAELGVLLHSVCSDCRAQAGAALGELQATTPGEAFWAEVDGEDYRLLPA